MSFDSGKDNASVVDSSVTEGKHETGLTDEPESYNCKQSEEAYFSKLEEPDVCHGNSGYLTPKKKGKWYSTRYFIIKSLNHHNIQQSIQKGIWATQVMNEPILDEAFNNSGRVILIFSVNMSGFFQGYAQMMSSIGWRRDNVWSQGNARNNPWGRSFKVKWLQLNDLPFQKTLHLKNPLNDNKPVKISRDCQELPQDIGEALCELLDGNAGAKETGRDQFAFRPASCYYPEEEYCVPPANMSWTMPQHYLSYRQVEANGCAGYATAGQTSPQGSTSGKSKNPKCANTKGNVSTLPDLETYPQCDMWGLPAESPHASSLTEDDFLEMSYEEYLEAHSRSNRQLYLPAIGLLRTPKESSGTKSYDKNPSPSSADRRRSRKRPPPHSPDR
ncbi:hypothetical protein MLD38_039102 [Melastoma candidum]|uniref:Uncharacterized protein n=1 Tax=Melastoma candidum TaxID=119954 RepID=A0ACB9L2D4_9MYRT|nr:hypothetical protein MLD38_039102 [Melastoma candidum]